MQEVWLRRRANDHKDALRLILEPLFQINAVDPPIPDLNSKLGFICAST